MINAASILYIEDSDTDILLLKKNFERHTLAKHWIVDTAETVAMAGDIFDPTTHAAALIDWNLPDGSGLDAAAVVRERSPTVAIIFLSGTFPNDYASQVKRYAPRACIVKNEMAAIIRAVATAFTAE